MDASIAFLGMINFQLGPQDIMITFFFKKMSPIYYSQIIYSYLQVSLSGTGLRMDHLGSMRTPAEAGVAQLVERVALI